jgi:protein-S-isoprenylcysteine O-methyltransferase Ste14
MTPETQLIVKVISGTVLVIAVIIGCFERWFRPSYIMEEASHSFPEWIGWLGWGLATLATLTYIFVDFVAWSDSQK